MIAVFAVLGVAAVFLHNVMERSTRQYRAWDAHIDRIVAQRYEEKQPVVVAQLETAPQPAAETAGSAANDPTDVAERAEIKKASLTASPEGKKSGRRNSRRHDPLFALAALPRLTAHTLLGLR